MMWTREKPTEPGYYWYRDRVQGPEIFIIESFAGELCVNLGDDWEALANYPGEFQGPITPQEDDSRAWYEEGARFAYAAMSGFGISSNASEKWFENAPKDFSL